VIGYITDIFIGSECNMCRKILVPTNASEASRKAFKIARAIAEKYDAGIELLHVVKCFGDFYSILYALGYEILEDELKKLGEPIINRTIDGDKDLELKKVIRFGNPAQVILDEIEKEDIDIVILGIRGYRKGYLKRRIREYIINNAKCLVLIIK
jgi:nucleotide-binding universal stress UspA family protein